MIHIINRHGQDFKKTFGVKRNKILDVLIEVILKGSLISAQFREVNGVRYYSNRYYYNGKYSVIYGIAENGYIETAYPKGGKI